MAKTILSFAIAFLAIMTVFASAVDAGSKSNPGYGGPRGYGGPLGVGPDFGTSPKSYSPKRSSKKRVYRRTKKRTKRRNAGAAKKVDTPKTDTENENSAISAAPIETIKTVGENTVETEAKPKDEPEAIRNVGCKKYFPSVDQTLTVDCE